MEILAGLTLSGVMLHNASAAAVQFVVSGAWGAEVETTSVSSPGSTWDFSFLLPATIPDNPTALFTQFSFSLNGSPIAEAPLLIEFFDGPDSGMFGIIFQSFEVFSLYGDAVLSDQQLALGSYDVFSGVSGGLPFGSGTLTVQAVPEPKTGPAWRWACWRWA